MNVDLVRDFLGWCALINIIIFAMWVVVFFVAHDWVYALHRKWFRILSIENFDSVHYILMGMFKIAIILFFLVPYLVLRHLG